jgi:hypothetical protein
MADYIATGWAGTRGRKTLQEDLRAMSDTAKRKRATTTEQKVATKQRQIRNNRRVETIGLKMARYASKAVELREEAEKVEKSGTGNVKAAQTYRKAADEYVKKWRELQALQKKAK